MYKHSSDVAQRQARQLWLSDLKADVDWDNLPDEERRKNLIAANKGLALQRSALTRKDPQYAELGRRMSAIEAEIRAIRPKLKGPSGVDGHFVDVARERLPKAQFAIWMREALQRAHRNEVTK